ncbi:MAG TPA: hypothetical protein PL070_12735 [Flavobacteriales bacterium]|nr:hypothetical protein [Flavobacteriales bacterium]
MNICTKYFERISAFYLLMLLWTASAAQSLYLGKSKMQTTEGVRAEIRYLNARSRTVHGIDSVAVCFEKVDTFTCRVSGEDELEYTFTFSSDKLVGMSLRLSCLVCLNRTYRKTLFEGKWRVDGSGYLYRSKNPARASIRRAVDCPYLYKVDIRSMEEPLTRDSFKKMRKVKKKWLGTLDSVMDERK